MVRTIGILCVLTGLFGLACESPAPPPPEPGPDPSHFSSERAWEHLKSLVEIGPRASGTPGVEEARSYIRAQLEAIGLEPDTRSFVIESELEDGGVEETSYETIVAVVPGESEDIVVLAAPYDSKHFESFAHLGANNGASGAALLLELARVLSVDPIPYTLWLVFLDGEAAAAEDAGPEQGFLGSRVLVSEIQEASLLSRLRLVMYFNQVADRDLVIARDLLSDRVVRKTFRRAARSLGHESVFPPDQPFSRPPGGHTAFQSVGFRRVMIVIDDRFGGDEAPGVYWQTEEDTLEQCDPASLEIVGAVTDAGLREVVALFRKVDRFSSRPVPAPEEEVAEPAEPTDPVEPSESVETAEPDEPTELVEPVATPEPTGAPEEAVPPTP